MRKTTLAAAFCAGFMSAANAQPNVLLVLADDMGVDASPCHAEGSSMVRMPTLSELCANGMVFDNAHAAPVCSPTRAMVLTGKYPSKTGVGSASAPLSDRESTLFDVMNREAPAYSSAVVGKWHLSKRNDLDHPNQMGVPYYFGFTGGGLRDYSSWQPVENGKLTPKSNTYATTHITDKAIQWLDQQSSPWFLWLAYNAPHSPFHAPPKALHSFGALTDVRTQRGTDVRKHYYAALEALDSELNRLLSSLSKDERMNTVVIFMGDNGTPGLVARRQNTVKNGKGSLYDGGTRVPLVINGPKVATGRSNTPVDATDIFATVLALTGAKNPAGRGVALQPVMNGIGPGSRLGAMIEMFAQKDRRTGKDGENGWMVRSERYALVAIDGTDPQLFDMKKDPRQSRDLLAGDASQNAETIARKLTALRQGMLKGN